MREDSKKIVTFRGTVTHGTERIFRYDLRKPGTIEEINNRIYSGAVGLLKIRPYLVSQGEVYEAMVKHADGADDFLAGDDDRDRYDVTMPFDRGNYIEIRVKNDSDTYDYDLNMAITLDYYGGKRRVI